MPAEQEGPRADSSQALVIPAVGGEREQGRQSPYQISAWLWELGLGQRSWPQFGARDCSMRRPADRGGVLPRCGAKEERWMDVQSAAAEQDFLLLAVFLQMCAMRSANGLASCNYPASPGEEGNILQPNLISLNSLQNCPVLQGTVYILLLPPQPPHAHGSAHPLRPALPFPKTLLSSRPPTVGLLGVFLGGGHPQLPAAPCQGGG